MPDRDRKRDKIQAWQSSGLSVRYVETPGSVTYLGASGYSLPKPSANIWTKPAGESSPANIQITVLGSDGIPRPLSLNVDAFPKESSVGKVNATTAALTLTPTNAKVNALTTEVTATTAALTLTSTNATVTEGTGYDVVATSGSLVLTGTDATAKNAEAANAWFNNQWWPVPTFGSPSTWWSYAWAAQVSATTGALTLTGTDASVQANVDNDVTADTASILLTPTDAFVFQGFQVIGATQANLTLTPTDAAVYSGSDKFITATSASIELTPTDATITVGISRITATSGALTLTPTDADVFFSKTQDIDGQPALVISTNYQSKTLYCNSSYYTID